MGERRAPAGLLVDGGSDWICLNRKFVRYVTTSEDELITGLKEYFKYSLLAAEVRAVNNSTSRPGTLDTPVLG